jgi:hypothetical protein
MDSGATERVRCAMPRNLTSKQAKFAVAVALGKSLADSYREAYEPTNPAAVSVYSNARRARKNPGIARRIAELQVRLLPGPEDMKALYQHALAVAIQLTVLSDDDKVRLRAAQWLAGEAEKREKIAEEARKLRDDDLEELQAILDAPAEDEAPAKSAAEILAEMRQATPREQEVPNPTASETRYVQKLASRPGYFPPKFRTVRARNPEGPEGA